MNDMEDNASPIARIKRRTKSKHQENSQYNFNSDSSNNENDKENNFNNSNTAKESKDVIYSKDDFTIGKLSKTDKDRDLLNPMDSLPYNEQIKKESELAEINMTKAKNYINEERKLRGEVNLETFIDTQTNMTREQMIEAAEKSAFSAKLRNSQRTSSPAQNTHVNNESNRNRNSNINYNSNYEPEERISNNNPTTDKISKKKSSDIIPESHEESILPGHANSNSNSNSTLGLPRVYIPEKYANFLLNDANDVIGGKVKKEKKLPLYMKVMAEAERQAQIDERNRIEEINKVKREKKRQGKIDIKSHMANHDKMMREKYGDQWQPPASGVGLIDGKLKKVDKLDALPNIKNHYEIEIEKNNLLSIKKQSKMNKLQRGVDELSNMNYIGGQSNNIYKEKNNQNNGNNFKLPSIIFDEGGPRKGIQKSSAYLRIQKENKIKKEKFEIVEEERREKLRRMKDFGKNLRVLASQKELELLQSKKELDDPYSKKGNQIVSPRIKHVSELTNKISGFSDFDSPGKTNKSKTSSYRSSGNGNISQEDTINIQLIDPKSGKFRTKNDNMDDYNQSEDDDMHGFSLLSNDRTPFKSPKKVRFNDANDDLEGYSEVFKISDQMKSPMRGEIEGSSDFLYSRSLKKESKGNKKRQNNNDLDDDPVVMLSKVAGGPLSYHPDWVNQMLSEDPDEEKYAEIYEQGYSIMMLEHGIVSEL